MDQVLNVNRKKTLFSNVLELTINSSTVGVVKINSNILRY